MALTITELAQLIMRQERVGWSKAMHLAEQRRAAAAARQSRPPSRPRPGDRRPERAS